MLKIGLMLNSNYLVPAWAYEVLTEIENSSYAQFELVIVNTGNSRKKKDPLLYQLFRRIEKRISKPNPDALRPMKFIPDSKNLFYVAPYLDGYRDIFGNGEVAAIKEANLDVILRFGFSILSGEILQAAKYGIWSYHHGDYTKYRGMPAGFWEVVNGEPKTGAMLQILDEKLDGGLVLRSATYQTHQISPKRNASNVAWQAAHFLADELKRLDATGKWRLETKLDPSGSGKLYKVPTNTEMLRAFPTLMIKKAKSFKKQPWQWQIAYKQGQAPAFFNENFSIVAPSNKDVFWADPFPIYYKGKHYVFYEELEHGKKAHISCATIENGVYNPIGQVLNIGTHLSYPFIFKMDDTYFMMPESMETGTIDLYQAVDFPTRWVKDTTLIKGVYAADPTILHVKDTWEMYLFATIGRKGLTNNSELYLWHNKGILSDNWKLHRNSPVCNDVSLARPAGAIFEMDGCLYRPSQDSINLKVNINLIQQIDDLNYRETKASEIKAWGDFRGLHTFNFCQGLTVVDVLHR